MPLAYGPFHEKITCALLVDDDSTTNYLPTLLLKRPEVTEKIL